MHESLVASVLCARSGKRDGVDIELKLREGKARPNPRVLPRYTDFGGAYYNPPLSISRGQDTSSITHSIRPVVRSIV